MTDQKSGTRSSVGLLDIATHVPGLLMDAPVILRGALTGFLARPSAKTSIGKVFQERAANYADKVFIKFGDEQLTYREANETANRYAAVLAARGVGHGDVVGIMRRNSPQSVLLMLAVVKCGAVAGMLNYHQRGKVLAHSIGLLGAKAIVAETDLIEPITESGADTTGLITVEELQRLAETAPTGNPGHHGGGAGQGQGVLHLHLGHHRHAQGQRDDALPLAAGAGRVRWARAAAA